MTPIHRSILCAVMLSATLVVGCKKSAPTPTASTVASTNEGTADATGPTPPSGRFPAAAPAAPVVVQEGADINATLTQLSLELRKYVVRTRSVPKTFEEFVAKSHAQVPPAPPGQKYAIQGQAVILKKL